MKKSRGQSLIDYAIICLLGISIIIFGIYRLGDSASAFFTKNDQEKKFNPARTTRLENPRDIISNIAVKVDGIAIDPPVEKILEDNLAAGSYVQTSGSAGWIAQSIKIMQKYITEIKKLTPGMGDVAKKSAFETALDNLNTNLSASLSNYSSLGSSDILEQKLEMINLVLSTQGSTVTGDVSTTLTDYLPTIIAGNRKAVIDSFSKDLLSIDQNYDYFLDPSLYTEFLGQKRNNTKTQDQALVNKIKTAITAVPLTQPQKQAYAGLIKVYSGNNYSQMSPTSYNGEIMCNTFSGTMVSTNQCEIPN